MVEMESRVGAHYNVDATPVCPVGRKKTVFFYSSIGLLLKLRHARAQSKFRTFPEKRPALQLAAQDLLAPRRRRESRRAGDDPAHGHAPDRYDQCV
jgi:hypothetical protein